MATGDRGTAVVWAAKVEMGHDRPAVTVNTTPPESPP